MSDRIKPVYVEAWTKAEAIQAMNELYPDVAFTQYQVYECPEWN